MQSNFLLQVIDRATGEVVQWEPGLSAELNFIEDITKNILSRGVGLFKSAKHVEADIRAGLEDAFHAIKRGSVKKMTNIITDK